MISHFQLAIFAVISVTSSGAYYAETEIEGATLRITVQQPVDDKKAAEIIQWLHDTAGNINLVYGRFPSPSPRIVVIPTNGGFWGSRDAVQFGQVTRGNGGTVQLYVNTNRPIEEFYEDWTATHEFSHLMLPLLESRYRWISEGFASYYQNVLLARAGQYTPEQAWLRLVQGFDRGQQSRPGMSPNAAAAGSTRSARMKIYWSGAVIALMADVELRRRSGGTESLDSVLGQLQQCCLPTRRQWSGPRLFRKLDSFIEEPVFMPLYRRYANSAGFPDAGPTLASLGISVGRNSVRLSGEARLANVRTAIESSVN